MDGNGNAPASDHFRIALIDIDVTNDDIDWDVFDDWRSGSSFDRRDKAELKLTSQRRGAIDLLAKLLQYHSDHDKSDMISDSPVQGHAVGRRPGALQPALRRRPPR